MIKNICVQCGNTIKLKTPKDIYIKELLETCDTAICNICDPESNWERVRRK